MFLTVTGVGATQVRWVKTSAVAPSRKAKGIGRAGKIDLDDARALATMGFEHAAAPHEPRRARRSSRVAWRAGHVEVRGRHEEPGLHGGGGGTLSRHLAILQQAGLATARRQGRWNYYRATTLAADALAALKVPARA